MQHMPKDQTFRIVNIKVKHIKRNAIFLIRSKLNSKFDHAVNKKITDKVVNG